MPKKKLLPHLKLQIRAGVEKGSGKPTGASGSRWTPAIRPWRHARAFVGAGGSGWFIKRNLAGGRSSWRV